MTQDKLRNRIKGQENARQNESFGYCMEGDATRNEAKRVQTNDT